MTALFFSPEAWGALLTLTALEIVLGVDNVIFLSIVISRLPRARQKRVRQIGLGLALIFRLLLLSMLVWIIGLTKPVITLFNLDLSWRDLILVGGGLFLIAKGTHEIHGEVEGNGEIPSAGEIAQAGFAWVIVQVVIIDLIFSLDSIITAIGMTRELPIMIIAVVIAMIVMYAASGRVADFVNRHPTTKMLALAFLLLIGVALFADGLGFHIPRGYIYFAITFAMAVESFNIIARNKRSRHRAQTD